MTVVPAQTIAGEDVIVTDGFIPVPIVIFKVTGTAHPELGVKVYRVVPITDVLIVAGLQFPEILLRDVVGNAVATAFWQNGPIVVNVGVVPELIVSFKIKVSGQPPAVVMLLYDPLCV